MMEPSDVIVRPLVTFGVIAYNQEKYVREAVEGAFAQTYQPLEIILSDDGSVDGTFAIMEEMASLYRGPHSVVVRSSKTNEGLAQHVNRVTALAKGEFFTIAAGDDISKRHRVEISMAAFAKDPSLAFVETGYIEIDERGEPTGRVDSFPNQRFDLSSYLYRKDKRPVGASRTYNMEALRAFPPLNIDCPTEDTTLMLRCLLIGGGQVLPDQTILRRIHENNLSAKKRLATIPLKPLRDQYLSDAEHIRTSANSGDEGWRIAKDWAKIEYCSRQSSQLRANGEGSLSIALWVFATDAPLWAKTKVCMRLIIAVLRRGKNR